MWERRDSSNHFYDRMLYVCMDLSETGIRAGAEQGKIVGNQSQKTGAIIVRLSVNLFAEGGCRNGE